ncbi:MAG: hypothetical protein E7496_02800 [Ruminococcus sp.]|nr:hypothetical protein [Ruminococcus sp.]
MNPMALMHIKPMLEKFQERHPKFIQFFGYAGQNVTEGSLIEISVTSPDGRKAITNIRLSEEDLELADKLKELVK